MRRPAHSGQQLSAGGDIEALIRERGVPATIVGNSMAAGAAILVAAEHPELVSRLVLIGPLVREAAISKVGKQLFRLLMARPVAAVAWKAYLPTLYARRKPVDFAEYRQQPELTAAAILQFLDAQPGAGQPQGNH